MARNNLKPIPDKVLVSENGAFVFTDTTISVYPDPDLPVPVYVTFQDGYFFFAIADGTCYASELNSTAINALTFITAEAKPDGLLAAIAFNSQLLLFGKNSLEFWVNTAQPTPAFPYTRSAVRYRGLAATTAIAGQQDGFGGSALLWVADHNRVVRLSGYEPEDISPPDLDRRIESIADKSTLEAYVYVAGGQARWVLSSPLWTWEFNIATQKWNERESWLKTRWRATQSVWAFNKWLIGDAFTSAIWTINDMAFKEGTDPLRFRLESGLVTGFPNRMRVARGDFDFATGVGLNDGMPIEMSPTAQISWSDDGGSLWTNPRFVPLGELGKYRQRIIVTQCGSAGPRGRRWRLDVSDPVYVGDHARHAVERTETAVMDYNYVQRLLSFLQPQARPEPFDNFSYVRKPGEAQALGRPQSGTGTPYDVVTSSPPSQNIDDRRREGMLPEVLRHFNPGTYVAEGRGWRDFLFGAPETSAAPGVAQQAGFSDVGTRPPPTAFERMIMGSGGGMLGPLGPRVRLPQGEP